MSCPSRDVAEIDPSPAEVLARVMNEIGVGTPDWKGRLDLAMDRLGYSLGWDGDRVTHVTEWGDPA